MYSVSHSFVYRGMILPDLEGIGRALHALSSGFPRSQLPDGLILPPERYDLKKAQVLAQEANLSLTESLRNNVVRFASYSFQEGPFAGLSIGVTRLKEDNGYGLQIDLDPHFYRSGQMEEFREGAGNKIEEALAKAIEVRRNLQRAEVFIEAPCEDSPVWRLDMDPIVSAIKLTGLNLFHRSGEELAGSLDRQMKETGMGKLIPLRETLVFSEFVVSVTLSLPLVDSLAARGSILSGVSVFPSTPLKIQMTFRGSGLKAEQEAFILRIVERVSEHLQSSLNPSPYR